MFCFFFLFGLLVYWGVLLGVWVVWVFVCLDYEALGLVSSVKIVPVDRYSSHPSFSK